MNYKAMQDASELDRFIELVREQNAQSYLEIGSKHGGSLWRIANALPKGSTIVSVDWPNADKMLKQSLPNLQRCVDDLCQCGYRAELIVGDSTDRDVVERVRAFAPFDLCLIDGGHLEPTVRADWSNYGPMAKIVAFHDIHWPIDKPTQPVNGWCHVATVWNELKGDHRSVEIALFDDAYGFGILWQNTKPTSEGGMTRPLYETHIAQDEAEISALVELLAQELVSSYLEIGARFGGSFWRIATSLPQGSRVVAVDLPSGPGSWPDSMNALRACIEELGRLGYDAYLIEGNSQQADVVQHVRALGPYDCVFIDADHRLPAVTSDWENYGPMAKLVAFHDITSVPNSPKPIHVYKLWERIRGNHRYKEFKFHDTGRHNGIGVLWR